MLKRQLDSIRKTKKGIKKRLVKGIKIFQKKKKTKSKKNGREQYEKFSEEEKYKSRQYERERCKNEKQRLVEYKKKLYNAKKIKVTQHFFYNHSQNI